MGLRQKAGICGALTMTCAAPATASVTQAGYISKITVMSAEVVMFNHSGVRSAAPACGTQAVRWTIATNTRNGAAKLAILLTAQANHKAITIVGTHSCPDWGDTESVEYLIVED